MGGSGRSGPETDLVQADVLEAVGVEDLEEVQRGVAGVLDIVPERGRHVSDVAALGIDGQSAVPREHPRMGMTLTWKLKVRAFELEPKRVMRPVPPL